MAITWTRLSRLKRLSARTGRRETHPHADTSPTSPEYRPGRSSRSNHTQIIMYKTYILYYCVRMMCSLRYVWTLLVRSVHTYFLSLCLRT